MKKYIKPMMNISLFEVEDIITTSAGGLIIGGGDGDATGGNDSEWITNAASTNNIWATMLAEGTTNN